MSATAIRDEDKTLLVAIMKGVTSTQMNFDRVGAEMNITRRAASERWGRLRTKLQGKKEATLREEDKKLLLAIMKGLTAADMDFERVGKDMGISKRAASERYGRLKTKLWGKATAGPVASPKPLANGSNSLPSAPIPGVKPMKKMGSKQVKDEGDHDDSVGKEEVQESNVDMVGARGSQVDERSGSGDEDMAVKASSLTTAWEIRSNGAGAAAAQGAYAQVREEGEEESLEEFHDAHEDVNEYGDEISSYDRDDEV